ncbi:hypothetical protein HK105_203558 [Polyrhizophydium stewartii]|uniref:Late embryogenesis abundant protein LEA-2 subgroup domain-containing protein n=1 Tax=Polyrhizophydium stewartii TaxID=2732419 RepID=A0ABR4NB82_9FUNG
MLRRLPAAAAPPPAAFPLAPAYPAAPASAADPYAAADPYYAAFPPPQPPLPTAVVDANGFFAVPPPQQQHPQDAVHRAHQDAAKPASPTRAFAPRAGSKSAAVAPASPSDKKLAAGLGFNPDPEPMAGNSFDLGRPRRRFPCCCCATRRQTLLCGSVSALLLIAAIVVGVLFWPRFPVLRVLDIQVVNGTNKLGPSDSGLGLNVQLGMLMSVSVVNSNKFHLKVDTIGLTAQLMYNVTQLKGVVLGPGGTPLAPKDGQGVQVGEGKRNSPITFPPGSNTTFTLNFALSYTTADDLKHDMGFAELLQGCGFLRNKLRPMTVHYKANAAVGLLKPFGFTPAFEDDIRINCPGPIFTALAAFDLPKSGIDAVAPKLTAADGTPASTSSGSSQTLGGKTKASSKLLVGPGSQSLALAQDHIDWWLPNQQ